MIAEAMEKESAFGGRMAVLCRGRAPIAKARLEGENGCINGTVSFFYTPLGVLVCASICGLEHGAYSMAITEDGGKAREIKTLYDKDGYAWCADIMGRLSPQELTKSRIELCKIGSNGHSIAVGSVKNVFAGKQPT